MYYILIYLYCHSFNYSFIVSLRFVDFPLSVLILMFFFFRFFFFWCNFVRKPKYMKIHTHVQWSIIFQIVRCCCRSGLGVGIKQVHPKKMLKMWMRYTMIKSWEPRAFRVHYIIFYICFWIFCIRIHCKCMDHFSSITGMKRKMYAPAKGNWI